MPPDFCFRIESQGKRLKAGIAKTPTSSRAKKFNELILIGCDQDKKKGRKI